MNPLLLMASTLLVFSLLWQRSAASRTTRCSCSRGLVRLDLLLLDADDRVAVLVDDAALIRKVRFPRQLVPLSVVATQLVTFGVMLVALMILDFALIPETRKTVWLAPPLAVAIVALVGGVALIVASLNVALPRHRAPDRGAAAAVVLPDADHLPVRPAPGRCDGAPDARRAPALRQLHHAADQCAPRPALLGPAAAGDRRDLPLRGRGRLARARRVRVHAGRRPDRGRALTTIRPS